MKNVIFELLLVASFSVSNVCLANSDVRLHGTLYKNTCIVNNDKPVDISFGNVGINKVDGIAYSQNIPLTISCDETPGITLNLKVNGTVSDFDLSAVQTNNKDLAIEIRNNGQLIKLSTPIFSTKDIHLTAVPVKRYGSDLTAGSFTAVATLVAEED